jgi:small-conductance mechanosensitive channel
MNNPKTYMRQLKNSIFLISILTLGICIDALAQKDTVQMAHQDSLLDIRQQQTSLFLSQADSIGKADSLSQVVLTQQLEALRSGNSLRKAELQASIDSLTKARVKREERIKNQVDSLRKSQAGIPVIIYGDTAFFIYSKLGPFSPTDRSASITSKIERLVSEGQYEPTKLVTIAGEESEDVYHADMVLFSITDRDAFWLNLNKDVVANQYVEAIKESVADYQSRNSLWNIIKRVIMFIVVLTGFIFGVKFMSRWLNQFNAWLLVRGDSYITGIKIRNYEFLSKERESAVVQWILNLLKWLIIALVVYLSLPVLFSIFPATKGIASTLFGYVLNPVKSFAVGLIGYIPELITIIVISLIARYFLRFLKFLASEVELGNFQIPGFYQEWATPTFNILRMITYGFTFVIIFPYLPGSDSDVFKGVSVFFGVMISLGSSSAISNIIAGLVITYMRAFKIGDRVKIGETTGDVIEKTMLVTRVRTIKNEDVTIPNVAILNGSTINYTTNSNSQGLILHSMVTIGYDVPWRQVHELLIAAALKTDHVKEDPRPFVFQTSLDDFYVSYQINAYTDQPGMAAKIYSQLHSNIQDGFNEAGVEILSPHYRAARDGNMVTIPANYLPPDYKAPTFGVNFDQGEKV